MADMISATGFMPHGMCFLWTPWLLSLHAVSDSLIALSYFSIPVVLALFAWRRPETRYKPVLWLFTAFILLCGTTHVFAIWVIWNPDYITEGVVKAATAIVSVATAIVLWPLLPKALRIPSVEQLEAVNRDLTGEIARRRTAEAELGGLARNLETRVEARTAELIRSNETLREYAATVAHDLQTPLRHIAMYSEMLKRKAAGELDPDAAAMLDQIHGATGRMRAMIFSLLEYSKLVDQVPDPGHHDIADILQAALAENRTELGAVSATVTVAADGQVFGDRELLVRLFSNLMDNAVKYRSDEPLILAIAAEPDGDRTVITVTDNGIGVPAEFADRIFEMLKRLHGEERPGTGIGLSLCRRIAEGHGGSVRLDTEYSGGARFVVRLPATPDREE
ncbi:MULTISPECIES: sensor histidine kinase [Hyphobacterium]|uniref:histidine kinase n=1 Tax=Hyphobacterium vulgare TaxID=1736751 RepID=A0ABV6ZXP3_9PROT